MFEEVFCTEASNLGTSSRCITTLLHWLPKWQDQCCHTSYELCSNYLCDKWETVKQTYRWQNGRWCACKQQCKVTVVPSPTATNSVIWTSAVNSLKALWIGQTSADSRQKADEQRAILTLPKFKGRYIAWSLQANRPTMLQKMFSYGH